ncbi:peptidoglycan editing factor PgeF [Aquamicrobium sp. LC103]|uniref:peptidoglycan editing factor PgeF n=1 Tax=Aquamicrobium sp. LC103 TaxID=1120658 RepID=UPI00063EBEA0|nr:peptidoglycan editing factor PgeF [Aquamicrobium sp. LC103]TKT77328.1 peptidoglycan editing factor PgeF [Aquamicrobium sp. LC103]
MLETVRPDPIRSPVLERFASDGIRHGFFTRVGGVSTGIYSGLNVGVGSQDAPANVAENRRRVSEWMGVALDRLVTLYQVHSPDALVVREPFSGERPKADALVTDRPGLALGVLAADCGPVLFADAEARVIGAAHAGWKGAFTGVLEATVEAMEGIGARRDRIEAVLGPSISAGNYEVGPEFVERFTASDVSNGRYFAPSVKPGHAMFDLNGYTVDRLRAAGVSASQLGRCTYADDELFFSYRRTTHRNEPDYGRQISAIVLEER